MNAVVTTILELIPDFLRAVATAANTSALAPTLDSVLQTGAALVAAGEAGAAELLALTDHVKAMVTGGTDPTQDDWDTLQARSDAAHALIQSVPASPVSPTE